MIILDYINVAYSLTRMCQILVLVCPSLMKQRKRERKKGWNKQHWRSRKLVYFAIQSDEGLQWYLLRLCGQRVRPSGDGVLGRLTQGSLNVCWQREVTLLSLDIMTSCAAQRFPLLLAI